MPGGRQAYMPALNVWRLPRSISSPSRMNTSSQKSWVIVSVVSTPAANRSSRVTSPVFGSRLRIFSWTPGPPAPPVAEPSTGSHGRWSGRKNSRSGFGMAFLDGSWRPACTARCDQSQAAGPWSRSRSPSCRSSSDGRCGSQPRGVDEPRDDDRGQTLERLVEQEHGRGERHGPGDGHHLLLATREVEPPARRENLTSLLFGLYF